MNHVGRRGSRKQIVNSHYRHGLVFVIHLFCVKFIKIFNKWLVTKIIFFSERCSKITKQNCPKLNQDYINNFEINFINYSKRKQEAMEQFPFSYLFRPSSKNTYQKCNIIRSVHSSSFLSFFIYINFNFFSRSMHQQQMIFLQ